MVEDIQLTKPVEPLDCGNCGASITELEIDTHPNNGHVRNVCMECGVSGPWGETTDEANRRWNGLFESHTPTLTSLIIPDRSLSDGHYHAVTHPYEDDAALLWERLTVVGALTSCKTLVSAYYTHGCLYRVTVGLYMRLDTGGPESTPLNLELEYEPRGEHLVVVSRNAGRFSHQLDEMIGSIEGLRATVDRLSNVKLDGGDYDLVLHAHVVAGCRISIPTSLVRRKQTQAEKEEAPPSYRALLDFCQRAANYPVNGNSDPNVMADALDNINAAAHKALKSGQLPEAG